MKNKNIIGSIFFAFGVLLISGCSSLNSVKSGEIENNSKIVIMPPHDVTQGGRPHPVGEGSGEQLQKSLQRELENVLNVNVLIYVADAKFNYTNEYSTSDSILEAERLNADYCLILKLGEFRNAAPMTFRSDFVTLNSAVMVETKSGETVWELNNPYKIEKSNLGDHYSLIEQISKDVASSIKK